MNETKTLDRKLKVGAMIGFITNIVSIIFCALFFIILIADSAAIVAMMTKNVGTVVQTASTSIIAILVIGLLIKLGSCITLIIMCNNVLKGRAKDGLVVGSLTLGISGLYLKTVCFGNFNWMSGFNIIFLGLNIASGVLLIMGKYSTQQTTVETVNQ
ncbi:hypothetical protein [Spiroplasma endosymbiont of Nebria brevicollis]|uniref:hypothetical protein n=1 Tax=Spiroplasma endosymbiont of Nebria brevicollis TaxID=3066284 RepID=UPI00313CC312